MSEPNSDVMEESGDSVEVDTQDQSDTKEEFTLENLPLVDDDVDSDTETTDDPSQADNPRLSTSESMDVTTAEPFADSSENKTPAKAKGASKKKVAGSTAKKRSEAAARRKSVNRLEKRISRKLDSLRSQIKRSDGTYTGLGRYSNAFFGDFEQICSSEEINNDEYPDLLTFPDNDISIVSEPRQLDTIPEQRLPTESWPSVESPAWLRESFAVFNRRTWTIVKYNYAENNRAATVAAAAAASQPIQSGSSNSLNIRDSTAEPLDKDRLYRHKKRRDNNSMASVDSDIKAGSRDEDSAADSPVSARRGQKASPSRGSAELDLSVDSLSDETPKKVDKVAAASAKKKKTGSRRLSTDISGSSGSLPSLPTVAAGTLSTNSSSIASASNIVIQERTSAKKRLDKELLKSAYQDGLFQHYNARQKTLGIQEILDFNRARVHQPFEFLSVPKKTQLMVEVHEVSLPIQPIFCTLSLHDVASRTKISEDFHFELNPKHSRQVLDRSEENLTAETLAHRALFTVTGLENLSNIYLVLRVNKLLVPEEKEKILFGLITTKKRKQSSVGVPGYTGPEPIEDPKDKKKDKPASESTFKFNPTYAQPYCWAAVPISAGLSTTITPAMFAGGASAISGAASSDAGGAEDDGPIGTAMSIVPIPAGSGGSFSGSLHAPLQIQAGTPSHLISPFSLAKTAPDDTELYDLLVNEKEFRKLKTFPGQLAVTIAKVEYDQATKFDVEKRQVDPSLVPVQPFEEASSKKIGKHKQVKLVRQIQEFGTARDFFMNYVNNLYVYPRTVSFRQKERVSFQVEMRLRDTDSAWGAATAAAATPTGGVASSTKKAGKKRDTTAGPALYGWSYSQSFVQSLRTAVGSHDKRPIFNDEFKVQLPPVLSTKHHLLFTIYDIDPKKYKETVLGYAILPLVMDSGKFILPQRIEALPLVTELPELYLEPEVYAKLKWLDVKKSFLQLDTRLVSSVYSQDPAISEFFHSFNTSKPEGSRRVLVDESKLKEQMEQEARARTSISGLQKASKVQLFRHFPVLLNMLIKMLCMPQQDEPTSKELFLSLLHLIRTVTESTPGKYSIYLRAYASSLFDNNLFVPENSGTGKEKQWTYPYEALVKAYSLLLQDHHPLLLSFDSQWFLFMLIVKSMTLYLHSKNQLTNASLRQNRFSDEYIGMLQRLLITLLCEHNVRGGLDYTMSCALFVKDLFPLIDRGIVLSLAQEYLDSARAESKSGPMMETFKFAFLKLLTNYEHFVQLNLPLPVKIAKGTELSTLSKRLSEKHFLAGQLIEEARRHYNSGPEDILRSQSIVCLRSVLQKHEALMPSWRASSGFDLGFLSSAGSDAAAGNSTTTGANTNTDGTLGLAKQMDPELRSRKRQSRLASMYLPFIILIVEDPSIISSMKLREKEEWLICLLYILRYCPRKLLMAWWGLETQKRQGSLITLLEQCVKTFESGPLGKQADLIVIDFVVSVLEDFSQELNEVSTEVQSASMLRKIVTLFQELLNKVDPDNPILIQHYYAPMQLFIEKCTKGLLHEASGDSVGMLVLDFMKRSNHKSTLVANFGATMLFVLMQRVAVESGSFGRIKTEMVVAMSKLIGTGAVASKTFVPLSASLTSIKLYAAEKADATFSQQIEEAINHVTKLLDYTARIEKSSNDPEMLQDLYHNISMGFSTNPELRVTWLDNLAAANTRNEDFEEAAECKLHIAALIAQYLSRPNKTNPALGRKLTKLGRDFLGFTAVAPNTVKDLSLFADAPHFESENWHPKLLIHYLKEAVRLFDRATRYELSLEIYPALVQINKAQRKYGDIIPVLNDHKELCERLVDVSKPADRVYPVYFRVAFYGAKWDDLDGKEFVYKKTPRWNLSVFKKQLEDQYKGRFPGGELTVLSTNDAINPAKLDPSKAYLQMTGVTPYFEPDEADDRVTRAEQHFAIHQFLFETSFSADGTGMTDDLAKQKKKKTIFITTQSFPYIKNRIEVIEKKEIVLSPIENAIELIKGQVAKLRAELEQYPTRLKSLQQVLQGSVVPMVNPGPLKVCDIFLAPGTIKERKQPVELVHELMDSMDKFIRVCGFSIKLNKSLIDETHTKFQQMVERFYSELQDRVKTCLDTLRAER